MKTLPELAQQMLAELKAIDLKCLNHAGQYKAIERIEKAIAVASEMAASKSGPVDPCNCGDASCAAQPGHCGAYKVNAEVMPTCPCCGAERCDCAPTFPDEVQPTRDSMHPQGM